MEEGEVQNFFLNAIVIHFLVEIALPGKSK